MIFARVSGRESEPSSFLGLLGPVGKPPEGKEDLEDERMLATIISSDTLPSRIPERPEEVKELKFHMTVRGGFVDAGIASFGDEIREVEMKGVLAASVIEQFKRHELFVGQQNVGLRGWHEQITEEVTVTGQTRTSDVLYLRNIHLPISSPNSPRRQ